jgi:hypothetical protein
MVAGLSLAGLHDGPPQTYFAHFSGCQMAQPRIIQEAILRCMTTIHHLASTHRREAPGDLGWPFGPGSIRLRHETPRATLGTRVLGQASSTQPSRPVVDWSQPAEQGSVVVSAAPCFLGRLEASWDPRQLLMRIQARKAECNPEHGCIASIFLLGARGQGLLVGAKLSVPRPCLFSVRQFKGHTESPKIGSLKGTPS